MRDRKRTDFSAKIADQCKEFVTHHQVINSLVRILRRPFAFGGNAGWWCPFEDFSVKDFRSQSFAMPSQRGRIDDNPRIFSLLFNGR